MSGISIGWRSGLPLGTRPSRSFELLEQTTADRAVVPSDQRQVLEDVHHLLNRPRAAPTSISTSWWPSVDGAMARPTLPMAGGAWWLLRGARVGLRLRRQETPQRLGRRGG